MGNGMSYSNDGLPLVKEDTSLDVVRRRQMDQQRQRLQKMKTKAKGKPKQDVMQKFYATEENYDDLALAVSEVIVKHAPEQEKDLHLLLHRYRGMEQKLFDKFEALFKATVTFDLERLPYKGDFQKSFEQVKSAAAWFAIATQRVTRVQAKVRMFLSQRRVEALRSQQLHARKPSQDSVTTMLDNSFPEKREIISAPAVDTDVSIQAAAKPKAKVKTRRVRRKKRFVNRAKRTESKTKVEADAQSAVSKRIRQALTDAQISAELLFFMHDEKNTGRIDVAHFMQLCRNDLSIDAKDLTDVQLKDFFAAIDTSHDGELQQDELEAFLKSNA